MEKLRTFLILLLIALTQDVFGQELKESEVPKIVVENFKKKYPDAYVYEWEWKKKKMVYEAEFIVKSKRYEAHFKSNGEWVKTEREVKKSEIPQVVWDSFSKTKYADWKIDDQEEHSTTKYDLVYEIKVKSGKQKFFLYFLPNGQMVESF